MTPERSIHLVRARTPLRHKMAVSEVTKFALVWSSLMFAVAFLLILMASKAVHP